MSQATVVMPTSGVVSGATFAADVNAGLDAVRTSWAGASAPSADTPEEGQHWADTSVAGKVTLKFYDGGAWVPLWTIITSTHVLYDGLTAQLTTVSDATYNILVSDRNVAYTTLTAPRVVNLIAASGFVAGTELCIYDESGNCSAANTITVTRASTDVIDGPYGSQTTIVISQPYGFVRLKSDGSGKWFVLGSSVPSIFSPRSIAANYTVANADAGATLQLTSTASSVTLTLSASTTYFNSFANRTINTSNRGHIIASTQFGNTWIYPGEQVMIGLSTGSTWVTHPKIVTLNGNQYFSGRKAGPLFAFANTLFHSTVGSDTANDGLTSTAGFKTTQFGIDFAHGMVDGQWIPNSSGGASILLTFSSGLFQCPVGGNLINGQLVGAHILNINGNSTAAASQTQFFSSDSNFCFQINDQACAVFTKVEFAGINPGGGASTGTVGISAARAVVVDIGNCIFGNFGAGIPIQLGAGDASVALTAPCEIAPGPCMNFANVSGGLFEVAGVAYIGAGTPNAYSDAFINASNSGSRVIIDAGADFSNLIAEGDTGRTFSISMNASLVRNTVQLPGNAAGVSTSGAQFS